MFQPRSQPLDPNISTWYNQMRSPSATFPKYYQIQCTVLDWVGLFISHNHFWNNLLILIWKHLDHSTCKIGQGLLWTGWTLASDCLAILKDQNYSIDTYVLSLFIFVIYYFYHHYVSWKQWRHSSNCRAILERSQYINSAWISTLLNIYLKTSFIVNWKYTLNQYLPLYLYPSNQFLLSLPSYIYEHIYRPAYIFYNSLFWVWIGRGPHFWPPGNKNSWSILHPFH